MYQKIETKIDNMYCTIMNIDKKMSVLENTLVKEKNNQENSMKQYINMLIQLTKELMKLKRISQKEYG
jgi:Mg2+ and Co2+ transporter CorA